MAGYYAYGYNQPDYGKYNVTRYPESNATGYAGWGYPAYISIGDAPDRGRVARTSVFTTQSSLTNYTNYSAGFSSESTLSAYTVWLPAFDTESAVLVYKAWQWAFETESALPIYLVNEAQYESESQLPIFIVRACEFNAASYLKAYEPKAAFYATQSGLFIYESNSAVFNAESALGALAAASTRFNTQSALQAYATQNARYNSESVLPAYLPQRGYFSAQSGYSVFLAHSATLVSQSDLVVYDALAAVFTTQSDLGTYIAAEAQFTTESALAAAEKFYAWAVNLNTGAVSKYDNYNFNSLHGTLGANSDGVFDLFGDTDNGVPILGFVESGKLEFMAGRRPMTEMKRVTDLYLGAEGGRLKLGVTTESGHTPYKVQGAKQLEPVKVNLARGHKGRYWQFKISNDHTGSKSRISEIEVVVERLSRKV